MLTGKKLGAAIADAIDKKLATGKVASKADVARHFGVAPPSIYDWINRGTVTKDKLPLIWSYFSDVVGLEHWGLVESQAWPFEKFTAAEFSALDPEDKAYIDKWVAARIAEPARPTFAKKILPAAKVANSR